MCMLIEFKNSNANSFGENNERKLAPSTPSIKTKINFNGNKKKN